MLITHEQEVAEHARRLIRLFDGRIVRRPAAGAADRRRELVRRPMSPFEILRFAVRGVTANKLRSA